MNTLQKLQKNVVIECGKEGFVSKAAIEKFKKTVKNDNSVSEDSLKQYVKNDYNLLKVEETDDTIRYMLTKKDVNPTVDKKTLLQYKLRDMKNRRTNYTFKKINVLQNVPEEILEEYTKLQKFKINIPIPEPSEILSKPDEYKPIVAMVLGNQYMKTLGKSHPYVRYFTLLAKHLGLETRDELTIAQDNLPTVTQKSSLNNDEDTDDEDN